MVVSEVCGWGRAAPARHGEPSRSRSKSTWCSAGGPHVGGAAESVPCPLGAVVSRGACGDSIFGKSDYGSETTMWGEHSLDGWHVWSATVPVLRLGVVRAVEVDVRRCSAERPAGVLCAGPCSG